MTYEDTKQEFTRPQPVEVPETPEEKAAREEFEGIKQALIGTEPEWVLPEVNPKALASKP